MKKLLLFLLLLPVLCFSQKKSLPSVLVGGGFVFYPGSTGNVHIDGTQTDHPLKSGYTLELTVDQPINSFLHLGIGSSFIHFTDPDKPYIPVYADIRVIGEGRFKLFSFINPGYGIYHSEVYNLAVYISPQPKETISGGFYIAYGFGVIYKKIYLQAKYNWLRFIARPDNYEDSPLGFTKHSKAYGVGGITFGVRLP